MNIAQPEKRRVRVSTGTLPSTRIASISACHPFSQQLDIVFPFDPSLLNSLEALEGSYGRAKIKLSEVLENAEAFVGNEGGNHVLVVSAKSPEEEDVWSTDPRGHLTLSVSKCTYERLGLVGQKLPFKDHKERHVIDISLKRNAVSPANRERQRKSIELWDQRRESELGRDAGLWDALYSWKGSDEPRTALFQRSEICRVQYKKKQLQDIHIPTPSLSLPPEANASKRNNQRSILTEDALEDWNRRVESLFEWVGMACLGAQRLQAYDRVDPYVALYEPPEPSSVGKVMHLQWRGLLHPSLVEKAINSVLSSLVDPSSAVPFVSISCHALTSSPVSYIPYTLTPTGKLQPPTSVPAKLPRSDGEDTWSLILERSEIEGDASSKQVPVKWCLAESLGQWDARWG